MMAVVEVSWEDQFGTRHTSSAKLEDTSPSGACLRVKVPVAIGSAMKVSSYRERFSGTARYCRTDRRDFVVGVQKDKNVNRFLTDVVAPNLPPSVPARNVPAEAVREEVQEEVHEEVRDTPRGKNSQSAALPIESQNASAMSAVRMRTSIAIMPSRDAVSATGSSSAAQSTFNRRLSQNESNDSPPPARSSFNRLDPEIQREGKTCQINGQISHPGARSRPAKKTTPQLPLNPHPLRTIRRMQALVAKIRNRARIPPHSPKPRPMRI